MIKKDWRKERKPPLFIDELKSERIYNKHYNEKLISKLKEKRAP